jgi:hypothetical protein
MSRRKNKINALKKITSIYKDNVPTGTLSVKDIESYLYEIFIQKANRKNDIVIGKYCPHQDRLVQLSSNPFKNQCDECMGEILEKYLPK